MENKTIPSMFRDSVQRHKEQLAVVEEFSHQEWTYGDLQNGVDCAARALLDMGLKPGDRASIWAPNMVEWIIAALAIQSAGGVLVPLNTRFKGKEARFVLERSGARFLFCIGNFLATDYIDLLFGDSNSPDLQNLEQVIVLPPLEGKLGNKPSGKSSEPQIDSGKNQVVQNIISWEDFLETGSLDSQKQALQNLLEERIQNCSPDDLSDIMFTSGTTGLPKGVMTTHYQSLRGYESWSKCVGLKRGDRYLIVNPFFHAFGYKSGWLVAFMMGASIYPRAVFDVADTMLAIQEHKITVFPGPPTLYQSILNHPDFEKSDLDSLRLAVTGAAAIPVKLIVEMRDRLNFENVLTGYGLTESSGIATMCEVGDDPETIATTSGKAIPDVEVIVVDDAGKELDSGEAGEVWIRGYNVTQGYLDDPEATSATIDANGWLHTGDIGVLNQKGYLKITDRKKDMFIMGGFNAYPAEIENLMSSHPAIAQVAVVGIHDEKFGEVGAAFVVKRQGHSELTSDQLIEWCKENMANYKVPRLVEFLDALPLNASGKVLKYELRKKFI